MTDDPRIDLLIAKYGRSLAVALAVVGVLAASAAGYAVAFPATTAVEEVDEERVSTVVTTSAEVRGGGFWEDGTWNRGERLESSPVYLLNASPTATIAPETTVPDDDATVTHEVSVRLRAERDGEAFWERAVLEDRTTVAVEDGVATSETTLNVSEVVAERDELERELADAGSVTVRVDVLATVERDGEAWYEPGPTEGEPLSTTLRASDTAYWFAERPSAERTRTVTADVRVERSRDPLIVGGLAVFSILSLAGAAFVHTRPPVDVETARQRVRERRYDEWISRGRLPMWIGNHYVELESLEDVVDVAIDANERVIHDRRRGLFAVVSGDVVYHYSRRGTWAETAWPARPLPSGGAWNGGDGLDRPSAASNPPPSGGDASGSAPADVPPTDDRRGLDDGGSQRERSD